MGVEFRPNKTGVRRLEYRDGIRIEAAKFLTQDLPPGIPIQNYHPTLRRGTAAYEISVDVSVQPYKLIFDNPKIRGAAPSQAEYEIRNVVFAQRGLPVRLHYDDTDVDGKLFPRDELTAPPPATYP